MATGLTVLNYPIESPEALEFWGSSHICNKVKSIIAFSLDLKNANDNLRRYGYPRGWRTKALYHFGKHVNQPLMTGIALTPSNVTWWEEMPYVAGVTIDSILAGNVKA